MSAADTPAESGRPTRLQDFEVRRLDGRPLDWSDWKDHVFLIVNTASACGFTPQYEGLEALQRRYADQGFTVLAFPCNQFGQQEPGDADTISSFCRTRFDLSLPLMEKVEVRGAGAHPLYRWLVAQAPGLLGTQSIKWNFTKFLIGRDGQVLERYAPATPPERLETDIQAALAQKRPAGA